MSNKITVSAGIQAAAEKVWDYYTNPLHIVNWNFADPSWHCPAAENDMRIGGTYKARMEARDGSYGFYFEAVYEAIDPGKSFTYVFGDRKATVAFAAVDGSTNVTVTFDPENANPVEMQRNGWQSILNNFKNYTELN